MVNFKVFIYLLLCALVALLLQGAVLKMALPDWSVPNLILVLVVFVAFRMPTVSGVVIAFILGLLLDVSTGKLLGPYAGAFAVVCGALASISQRLYIKAYPALALTVFFSSLLATFIFIILTFEVRGVSGAGVANSFGEAFVTALLAPLLMIALDRIIPEDRELAGPKRRSAARNPGRARR